MSLPCTAKRRPPDHARAVQLRNLAARYNPAPESVERVDRQVLIDQFGKHVVAAAFVRERGGDAVARIRLTARRVFRRQGWTFGAAVCRPS
jgi:hypothetical protein